jgi:hypothetical protein
MTRQDELKMEMLSLYEDMGFDALLHVIDEALTEITNNYGDGPAKQFTEDVQLAMFNHYHSQRNGK